VLWPHCPVHNFLLITVVLYLLIAANKDWLIDWLTWLMCVTPSLPSLTAKYQKDEHFTYRSTYSGLFRRQIYPDYQLHWYRQLTEKTHAPNIVRWIYFYDPGACKINTLPTWLLTTCPVSVILACGRADRFSCILPSSVCTRIQSSLCFINYSQDAV